MGVLLKGFFLPANEPIKKEVHHHNTVFMGLSKTTYSRIQSEQEERKIYEYIF
jgi:hypothetical protein